MTTLYTILNGTHKMLDKEKLCEAIGMTLPELNNLSILGVKDKDEEVKKICDALQGYVFFETNRHSIISIKPYHLTSSCMPAISTQEQINTAGERNETRQAGLKGYHRSIIKKAERWRKMIMALLLEKGLIDVTDLSKSKLVAEYKFGEWRLKALMMPFEMKLREELRDDIYMLFLLAEILGLKFEITDNDE